jgi:hypothetical protein
MLIAARESGLEADTEKTMHKVISREYNAGYFLRSCDRASWQISL